MASFFQSFRQSLMPKQLLRFALSRLDLLDENALDLDNLDFALGRNTVLEFRDVGLVLQVRKTTSTDGRSVASLSAFRVVDPGS